MYRSPIPPSLVAPYCRIGRSQGQYRFTKHETLYAQTHTPGILHLARSRTSGHRRRRNTRTQRTHTHTHSPRRATFSTTPAAVPSPPIDRPTDRPTASSRVVCVSHSCSWAFPVDPTLPYHRLMMFIMVHGVHAYLLHLSICRDRTLRSM